MNDPKTHAEYVRLYLPNHCGWIKDFTILPGGQMMVECSNSLARVFPSVKLADVEEISRRYSKVTIIPATFEDWVNQEGEPEEKKK